MGNLLERLPSGSRIAVIRLRSLGDCVLTTPAIALLKAHRPDLKITVIVEPRFTAVFEGNPDVDEIRAGAASADVAVNFHGGTRSTLLALRSTLRAGFAHHRYSFIYSHKVPRAQAILGVERKVHTAEHLASAIFWMGVPKTEIPRAKLFAGPPPDLPPYAVIHSFASAPDKTWPADRFIEAARSLNLHTVFLAGPTDDVGPFSEISCADSYGGSPDPRTTSWSRLDLPGQEAGRGPGGPPYHDPQKLRRSFETFEVWKNAPLARVKALMSGAALFIGNDSGPAHIAAAFGVPSVVIFGASDPAIWGPWRTESQVLASQDLANISVQDVLAAAESLKVRA